MGPEGVWTSEMFGLEKCTILIGYCTDNNHCIVCL